MKAHALSELRATRGASVAAREEIPLLWSPSGKQHVHDGLFAGGGRGGGRDARERAQVAIGCIPIDLADAVALSAGDTMEYVDLSIHFSPGPDGGYNVAADCEKAGEAGGILVLPFKLEELAGAVFGVANTLRDLTPDEPAEAPSGLQLGPREFGAQLFEALFQGDVRALLNKTQGAIGQQKDLGIRIRMKMDLRGEGMPELASLPWELMAENSSDLPLVLSTHTVLARSLSVLQPTELAPFEPPLRIMVVCSNPKGTGDLELGKEQERIEKSWALLPGVHVDFVEATYDAMAEYLADEDPHVMHYMGHGDFDSETGGTLILETKDGEPDPVGRDRLQMLFGDEKALRLVFLNACKTASTRTGQALDPFAGVASSLIKIGIPAVVAMQFPISDEAAIEFADTFYRRIARGAPVDTAVAEARKRLFGGERSEWATPVLFLRSPNGELFPVSAQRPASEPVAKPGADSDTGRFKVFLATPTDTLRPTYRQIKSELEADGVEVITDVPPPHADEEHRAAVLDAVRSADLSVHLLGDRPGEPMEADDGRTYPIEQLKIGLESARSQLILVPEHIDFATIEDRSYHDLLMSLGERSRDSDRFEIVRTGRHQMMNEIRAKRRQLEQSTPKNGAGGVENAFVDVHASDMTSASALIEYLAGRKISPLMSPSTDSSPAAGLKLFEENLSKVPLLIIVFGGVAKDWVVNRLTQAVRVVTSNGLSTRIGVYVAPPDKGSEGLRFPPFYDVLPNMDRFDPATVDALIAKAAENWV